MYGRLKYGTTKYGAMSEGVLYVIVTLVLKRSIMAYVSSTATLKREVYNFVQASLILKRDIFSYIERVFTLIRKIGVWVKIQGVNTDYIPIMQKPSTNCLARQKPSTIWTDINKPQA